MKKLFAVLSVLVATACANPSMERGLELLTESLAELEASVTALDIEGMQSDLDAMTLQVEDIIATTEEMQDATTGALATIAEINSALDRIGEELATKVTKEQVASLLEDVQALGEDIDMLVFLADYDYDGVMNGLDQCPDTPITEINNVDSVGCTIDG